MIHIMIIQNVFEELIQGRRIDAYNARVIMKIWYLENNDFIGGILYEMILIYKHYNIQCIVAFGTCKLTK